MAFSSIAAIVLSGVFLAVYLPDIGHGFIRDDFGWIRGARLVDGRTLLDLFQANVGFYRPVVSASFAADYALWGLWPFGFALTNIAICLVNALLLFVLVRRVQLPAAAAVLACGVWALNFHGINMALLWISGRTALLVVCFALLTAIAMQQRRTLAAGGCALLAMLCKEEAVLLPALWTLMVWLDVVERRSFVSRARHAIIATWPLWLAVAIYIPLRLNSGAFGASNAPSYYQFTFQPLAIVHNVFAYADRAGTLAALIAVVLLLLTGRTTAFDRTERRALKLAAVWLVASLGLTIFLPVRSSLYAVLPSIGSAIAVAAVASRAQRAVPKRFARACVTLVVLAVLCMPLYHRRNDRLVAGAELTTRVLDLVSARARTQPDGGVVALFENPDARVTFDVAFGTLFPDALALWFGTQWTGQVWPPNAAPVPAPAMRIRLHRNGKLEAR